VYWLKSVGHCRGFEANNAIPNNDALQPEPLSVHVRFAVLIVIWSIGPNRRPGVKFTDGLAESPVNIWVMVAVWLFEALSLALMPKEYVVPFWTETAAKHWTPSETAGADVAQPSSVLSHVLQFTPLPAPSSNIAASSPVPLRYVLPSGDV
jgi:hypothetical protein